MVSRFFLCSAILANVVIAAVAPVYARSTAIQCNNFAQALSILESLPIAKAFCYPIVYPDGVPTKTKSTAITITSATCSTKTKTSIVHTKFTDTEYSYIEVPQLTSTQYASTVLITTGSLPVVNKRAPSTTPPSVSAIPTPTALKICPARDITSACSTIVSRVTVTNIITSTHFVPCSTTTTTTTTVFNGETTITLPLSVTPPLITVTVTDIRTQTVPAACAGPLYSPGGDTGAGNIISPLFYPNYPQNNVDCCVFCWSQENCIGSSYGDLVDLCTLLLRVDDPVLPGANAQCPLGIFDFSFGPPSPDGDILPGPCGM